MSDWAVTYECNKNAEVIGNCPNILDVHSFIIFYRSSFRDCSKTEEGRQWARKQNCEKLPQPTCNSRKIDLLSRGTHSALKLRRKLLHFAVLVEATSCYLKRRSRSVAIRKCKGSLFAKWKRNGIVIRTARAFQTKLMTGNLLPFCFTCGTTKKF